MTLCIWDLRPWHSTYVNCLPPTRSPGFEVLPTSEDFLLRIARNHVSGNHTVGGMLRFIPGGIGHVAREIVFTRKENGGFETSPRIFSGDIMWDDIRKRILDFLRR